MKKDTKLTRFEINIFALIQKRWILKWIGNFLKRNKKKKAQELPKPNILKQKKEIDQWFIAVMGWRRKEIRMLRE